MLISSQKTLDGARVLREIGRLTATSRWRGVNAGQAVDHQVRALEALVSMAREFEADAIVGIDYAVDTVETCDLGNVRLERVAASGLAVKLARG